MDIIVQFESSRCVDCVLWSRTKLSGRIGIFRLEFLSFHECFCAPDRCESGEWSWEVAWTFRRRNWDSDSISRCSLACKALKSSDDDVGSIKLKNIKFRLTNVKIAKWSLQQLRCKQKLSIVKVIATVGDPTWWVNLISCIALCLQNTAKKENHNKRFDDTHGNVDGDFSSLQSDSISRPLRNRDLIVRRLHFSSLTW